jgi:ABC-type nitrate/sulfonate/bicarbonate transport system substrate-binding protein
MLPLTVPGRALAVAMLVVVAMACAGPGRPASPSAAPAGAGAASQPAGASAGSPAGSAATPAPRPAKVRSAYVAIASNMLPSWIALEEGIYQKYALDVELSYIAGAAKISETLVAGELDVGVAPASSAIGPGLEGADTVMVASWTNKLSFSALVQSNIQSVADLRGKRIGVSRRGSNSEIWAAAVLNGFGLAPERDYAILSIGGQTEQFAALQNGAIDAAILTPPTNLQARQLGFRELLSYKDHSLDFANVGAVTTRRYLRDNPDVVDRYLRASAEAVAIMLTQPEPTLRALRKYTQVDDPELLTETLSFEHSRTARDMLPTAAGLRLAMEELASANPKAATANPDDYLALDPIKRLNDSGFIASLYR